MHQSLFDRSLSDSISLKFLLQLLYQDALPILSLVINKDLTLPLFRKLAVLYSDMSALPDDEDNTIIQVCYVQTLPLQLMVFLFCS